MEMTANFNPRNEEDDDGLEGDAISTTPGHEVRHLTVDGAHEGERLDKLLAQLVPEISRSKAQWLLSNGYIRVNAQTVTSSSSKPKPGDALEVTLPVAPVTEILPVPMDLDIVYEDRHLLVINKPAGMPVHPACGHYDDTLVNGLLAHCGHDLSAIGGEARPGIVHRLDKDTSGLMLVAKNDQAHRKLAAQLMDRSLSRTYLALVWGRPTPLQGTIQNQLGRHPQNRQRMAVLPDGGKEAITHYRVHSSRPDGACSWVECKLQTGRTHQIRVHMAHIGHGLLGDATYGRAPSTCTRQIGPEARDYLATLHRQALHAAAIGFIHPESGERLEFTATLPPELKTLAELILLP
jgi:23S rRNA pseudouridine1911/1915/1917 synthase